MKCKALWRIFVLIITLLLVGSPTVEAKTYDILGLLPGTVNVFHTALNNNQPWKTLAHLGLEKSQSNTYDPDTGLFQGYFKLYSDSSLTNPIGEVVGNGSLPGANFNNFTAQLGGNIVWSFKLTTTSKLLDYLVDNGFCGGDQVDPNCLADIKYYDYKFYTASNGDPVNSINWDGNMNGRLWGADQTTAFLLGNDIHFHYGIVPEPASIILMTSGLLGTFGYRKNRFNKKS